MGIFESIERYPVEYLPTGDHALLMAWATMPLTSSSSTMTELQAVLCLEDGRAIIARIDDFKFDYRYDLANERWVDVSKTGSGFTEGDDGNADQEDADDGGAEVPGRVPEGDGASEGDQGSGP